MPGVYELADADKQLIYIGQSARDVPNRIRQHQRRPDLAEAICYWRYAYSRIPQADEAVLIAKYLEQHGQLPRYNRMTPKLRDRLSRYLERSR